ncbi:MAG: nucleoside hydrolase [Pseudomonadota bacterium]
MGVWIDTDLGADDLFAILMAARHGAIDGMSLSFGCTRLSEVVRTADWAAATFGWTMPIHRGADRALLGGLETAEAILGPRGFSARGGDPTTPAPACTRAGAAAAMAAWLAAPGVEARSVLALGPLTNLATVVIGWPECVPRLSRVIWMGGARDRGNHTPHAEFNAFADPEALAALVARGVPLTIADLTACRAVTIDERAVARVAAGAGPNATTVAALLGGYLDIALSRGRSAMALYDPLAAAALIAPHLFDAAPVGLSVALAHDGARGRTIVDRGGAANAALLWPRDPGAIVELCLSALERA